MIHTADICRALYIEKRDIINHLEHSGTYGIPLQAGQPGKLSTKVAV